MQIDTKYNVGQHLWFLFNDEVKCESVTNIHVTVGLNINPPEKIPSVNILYYFGRITKAEENLFTTKEGLIKSL